MIISPPFLPDRSTLTEEAWLDAAMAQPLSRLTSTRAPEGSFPLSLKLAWHNGLHIQAPQHGGNYLPVRAVADGEVVFAHAPTTPNADVTHALNYNPFNNGTPSPAWTSDGFVVIRHTTEIGATGTTPTEVTYFSAYMHLSRLANCPKRNAPWKAGDAIYRKDELGAPGQIYGDGGQIHFEICCDEPNLRQFVPRAPVWADPLAPTAPTANGRTDSIFGSMYVYLPAGTPTSTAAPTSHLRTGGPVAGASAATDHFVPNAAQWVEVRYQQGEGTVSSYRASDGAGGLKVGEPIGQSHPERDFEYNLYTEATRRHNSLDAATQALSSPSGWYELLRFGRNLGPDPLPAHAAHWREIPTATGTVWADLNAPGTFKFSDADFPAFRGWNCFDDDLSPTDQRCDSLHLKTLIRNPDPTDDRRMERAQLARRLGEPEVRAKLRRAICRFPSEWDQRTVVERYSWLLTEDFKPEDDDATGAQKWERFVKHAQAISFTNLPAEFLKADWRFHPREFVEVMRTCGWLSENEAKQLFPKTALRDARPTGWVNEAVSPSTGNLSAHLTQLNKTMRKYCITTPQRMATFWGNVMQETQWFRLLAEGGGSSTRYAPWYGRGFLQLTWPANYIKYARFKGISVSAQLESRLVSAQQTANNARNSSALRTLEGSMPANLISLRDAVESSQGRPMEPSDSAGVYWAWSAANQSADPAAAFARTTVDGLTYYTHSSFGNVAATVNVGRPSTDYTRINGVQARFQAYTTAVMVLLEGELFPDAQGKMQETPEGWNKRLP